MFVGILSDSSNYNGNGEEIPVPHGSQAYKNLAKNLFSPETIDG